MIDDNPVTWALYQGRLEKACVGSTNPLLRSLSFGRSGISFQSALEGVRDQLFPGHHLTSGETPSHLRSFYMVKCTSLFDAVTVKMIAPSYITIKTIVEKAN